MDPVDVAHIIARKAGDQGQVSGLVQMVESHINKLAG